MCVSYILIVSLSPVAARGQGDQVPTVARRLVRRRKVTRGGDSDNVIILQNYDKSALWTLLGNKEMKVGEVVLVNGKPAVIKKRKSDSKKHIFNKMMTNERSHLKNLQKIRVKNIKGENIENSEKEKNVRKVKIRTTQPRALKRKVSRRRLIKNI